MKIIISPAGKMFNRRMNEIKTCRRGCHSLREEV